MGFKTGAYLTIWKEGNNFGGNYVCRQCSTNRKDPNTGEYSSDFSGFVRFVGKAKDVVASLPERSRIRVKECEVTTYFSNKSQRNECNFVVWDCETVGGTKKETPAKKEEAPVTPKSEVPVAEEADDDLPF